MKIIVDAISLEIEQMNDSISSFKQDSKSIFVSSSFQTHSIPLLHIISQISNEIPVYFLNTGFHFPETLKFKKEITDLLQLNVFDLESPITKSDQRNSRGMFHFVSNVDHCCYLNKVLPLEPIVKKNDIWISGLRRNQTEFRSRLDKIDQSNPDITKYYPMLDWSDDMIEYYRTEHKLPKHPLHDITGGSIGCEPCTSFRKSGETRSGRWEGSGKSECGIHEKSDKS